MKKNSALAAEANENAIPNEPLQYNTNDQKLCSGYGMYHSPNAETNPRRLVTVTLADIEAMLMDPPSVAKGSAQWVIPSTLLDRTSSIQHRDGEYWALWSDIDKAQGVTFTELVEIARQIIPGNFIAYTSRSATEENQKARLIIMLSEPVSGGVWKALQKILNDKLEAAGVPPDRASETNNQLCYLPNRGEFYQYHIEADNWKGTMNPDRWADELAEEAERQAAEDAKNRAAVKPERIHKYRAAMPEGGIVPSEYIRANYPSTKQLLEDAGAIFVSERDFYPGGRTKDGNPGGRYDPEKDRFYSHHANDPFSDGYWHGQINLLMQHNGIDWQKEGALVELCSILEVKPGVSIEKHNRRAFMAEKSRQEAIEQFGAPVTDEAQKLADQIHGQLLAMLGVDAEDEPEEAASIKPNAENITRMINGAFWSGSKSKVFLLNHSESLIQFRENDSFKFLAQTFGAVIERAAVEKLAERLSFGCEKPEAEANARRKFVTSCMTVAKTAILDYLKYHNQRESIEWRVDMFGKFSRMELIEDKARIVLTHKPFPQHQKPEAYARIIADYKEHFSRFDEFLKFVAMARFALDRKKAYLWILADSDWGKGFLTGVLAKLGVCVETSMKEVEAMLEGKPVGRSAEDFKRAMVLLIDEFKTVKSELKQLQSEITLSPKNQLSCTVEIFAKVFTSAESVGSLVTENGVEDQFANRMSTFVESGDITKRAVFQEVGNSQYFRAVLAHTAETLNREISTMQQLGRETAETVAEEWLNGFISRYGLDTVYERFSDSLPDLVGQILEYLKDRAAFDDLIVTMNGDTYVKSPAKVLDDYLTEHFDQSQIAAFRKKKPELLKMMSEDGEGSKTHRIGAGKPFKAVKLRKL